MLVIVVPTNEWFVRNNYVILSHPRFSFSKQYKETNQLGTPSRHLPFVYAYHGRRFSLQSISAQVDNAIQARKQKADRARAGELIAATVRIYCA